MSKSRPLSARRPHRPAQPPAPSFLDDEPAAPQAPRPAIWADGKQAPSFQPMAFAEAGMLLARDAGGNALEYMSTEAAAKAAQIEHQDWHLEQRLGRAGRALPTAPAVARSLDGFAHTADAARRLLYGAPDTKPEPVPAVLKARPEPPAAKVKPVPDPDPDLSAIRAVLDETSAAKRRPTTPPQSWEVPPPATETALRRVLDWSLVRVLAGGVLVFATPIGYGRALYRHLDGADLRDIVSDCHRMRIN